MQYLHHSDLLNSGLGYVSIADVAMETKACVSLQKPKDIAGLKCKESIEGK
jgi:hypothetical protein